MDTTRTETLHQVVRTDRPSEVDEVHTRVLRLALGINDSRSYWEHVDPAVPLQQRPLIAFEQRWFGSKSLARIRFLIANFADRYDAFPEGLAVLRRWAGVDASTRQAVCHWHLQLSDPLYRRFTGQFLVERRMLRDPTVDRDAALRWVKNEIPGRWSEATYVQFASKLLSAAAEAGLLSKGTSRAVLFPKVSDIALSYLMYLLRGIHIKGTLISNPYLASVGITDDIVDHRLRNLPGLEFRRMGQLTEFEWQAPSLLAWAETAL